MFTSFVTQSECMATKFGEWLLSKLSENDWTQSQLARRANVRRQVIYNYINVPRENPDKHILASIAKALGVSEVEIFRAAGVIKEATRPTSLSETIAHKLKGMTDEQIRDVLEYIEFKQSQTSQPAKINREGVSPPELIKRAG